jgi:hypothetical protein
MVRLVVAVEGQALVAFQLSRTAAQGTEMDVGIRALVVQWNPSTVAGLQSLLTGTRRTTGLGAPTLASASPPPPPSPREAGAPVSGGGAPGGEMGREHESVKLVARLAPVRILLNKEWELRRLLEVRPPDG